jgi:heptosyltransferase-1
MGDILMTIPAAKSLRMALPQASISYLIEEPFKDLVEGSPLFDEIIVLPKNITHGEFIRYLFEIRKKKFDVILDFHGGPRASLLTFMSGAKTKIGYQVKHKSFLYDIKIPRSPETGHIHSVENHMNLVRALGIQADASSLEMPPATKSESKKLNCLFKEQGLTQAKVIVLHIGAGNEFRLWGVDNLSRFIDIVSEKKDRKVVLVGAKEDNELAESILSTCQEQPVSLVGELNLRELRWVISKAHLFVGPDSGPMHMAATTDTPIVALFGPTHPAIFSPWKARAVLVEHDLECRPCRQKECVPGDFRCIRDIRPHEVFEACLAFLE